LIGRDRQGVSSEGCTTTMLAGTVVDGMGRHLEGYPVHVWGPELDIIVVSGSADEYGPSGWEVLIGASRPVDTWYVQLHEHNVYQTHPPLSPVVSVGSVARCLEGVTLVSFIEGKRH